MQPRLITGFIYNNGYIPTGETVSISERKETYGYTADGDLATVAVATGTATTYTYTFGSTYAPPVPLAASGTPSPEAAYTYDAMGRVTTYNEYDTNPGNIVYSWSAIHPVA